MYRAASAGGGFANIDLNPKRPTTNRTAIRITNARNKYRTKGAARMPPINIPWCAHWITMRERHVPQGERFGLLQ
jgi:hypothetical protein